jgi:hypothetical protein
VSDPFTDTATIDDAELNPVGLAVRMMDNVVDASKFCFEAQVREAAAAASGYATMDDC